MLKPRQQSQAADALYLAQSAKNSMARKQSEEQVSVKDVIQNRKRQLLIDNSQDELDEEDEIGNMSIQRQQRKRKTSEDTEDLEDLSPATDEDSSGSPKKKAFKN